MNQSFKDSEETDYVHAVVPCPKQIMITDSLMRSMLEAKNVRNDIFYLSPNDNEVSLSKLFTDLTLSKTLKRKPQIRDNFVAFMKKFRQLRA